VLTYSLPTPGTYRIISSIVTTSDGMEANVFQNLSLTDGGSVVRSGSIFLVLDGGSPVNSIATVNFVWTFTTTALTLVLGATPTSVAVQVSSIVLESIASG